MKEPGRKRSILRRIGIIGPPLAALSVLDKLDQLVTFNEYIELLLNQWHLWIAALWNWLFSLFGFSAITKIDAVFFTFFLMLFLSFLTSYSKEATVTQSGQQKLGYAAAIVGVMLIAVIFTAADIKTYALDPTDYNNSYQQSIYFIYKEALNTRAIPANEYIDYIIFALGTGFYFLTSVFVWGCSLILARGIGVRIHIWKLARRLYFVIGLAGIVLAANGVIWGGKTLFAT